MADNWDEMGMCQTPPQALRHPGIRLYHGEHLHYVRMASFMWQCLCQTKREVMIPSMLVMVTGRMERLDLPEAQEWSGW